MNDSGLVNMMFQKGNFRHSQLISSFLRKLVYFPKFPIVTNHFHSNTFSRLRRVASSRLGNAFLGQWRQLLRHFTGRSRRFGRNSPFDGCWHSSFGYERYFPFHDGSRDTQISPGTNFVPGFDPCPHGLDWSLRCFSRRSVGFQRRRWS